MLHHFLLMTVSITERQVALLGPRSLPRYWAAVWVTLIGGSLSFNTLRCRLRFIGDFYEYADLIHRDGWLDDVLASLDFQRLKTILQGYFARLQGSPTGNSHNRWQTVAAFVSSTVELLSQTDVHAGRINALQANISRLNWLFTQLQLDQERSPARIRSLPSAVLDELYDIVLPDGKRNPIRSEHVRWRGFASFRLFFHGGLRLGELLGLAEGCLNSEMDSKGKVVFWLNVKTNEYEDDTRYTLPSIKTSTSIRQIPVSKATADVLLNYSSNYRGKPTHSWFLNSTWNRPLSAEAMNQMFHRFSEKLSPNASKLLVERTGKTVITPHDLRHTAAVIRYKQFRARGDTEDDAMQLLRSFFGWSRDSDMPLLYPNPA